MQHFNLEDFEFSQQFLYFWDRIERSYFFINTYEELARKGEEPDGRLMMFLLSNPLNDGGQWDMLINLVEKYGLVPKAVWPEAFTSNRSMRLRRIINHKVCYKKTLNYGMISKFEIMTPTFSMNSTY